MIILQAVSTACSFKKQGNSFAVFFIGVSSHAKTYSLFALGRKGVISRGVSIQL